MVVLFVNRAKFSMHVTAYMLELYNEKLIDLFAKPNVYDEVSHSTDKCAALLFVSDADYCCVLHFRTSLRSRGTWCLHVQQD